MAVTKNSPAPDMVVLSGELWQEFLELVTGQYKVIGPVRRGSEHVFAHIKDPHEIDMAYVTTILPPKKVFHQPFQVLFSFDTEEGTLAEAESGEEKVVWGIHPCDVHAIAILDKVYGIEYPDPYYLRNRENTIIVAKNCTEIGENCFCLSMGTGPALRSGYDLLLTDLGGRYLVEVGTERGRKLLSGLELVPAPRVVLVEKEKRLSQARQKFKKRMVTQGIQELLEENFRHPIWEELMRECLACGSCTMVCPTCFCYNVVDKMDLDLKTGRRQREWDSCMLLEYAQVALGQNFRRDRDARIKQRMYHKLLYYEPQFGTLGCVGCGRCISACVKRIDITDVVSRLAESVQSDR